MMKLEFQDLTLALVFLLCVLQGNIVQAGRFDLVVNPTDGRGIPYAPPRDRGICTAYLKNLNSFAPDLPSMECGRPINSKFKDFSKPEWKALNPLDYVDLVRKMDRSFLSKPTETIVDDSEWMRRFAHRMRNNEIHLSITRIDVDDDGIPDNVIRYERAGVCNAQAPQFVKQAGLAYFVVNGSLTEFDGLSKNKRFLAPGVRHDVFLYRARAYFDFLSMAEGHDKPKLVVQQTNKNYGPTPVCFYRYDDTPTTNSKQGR